MNVPNGFGRKRRKDLISSTQDFDMIFHIKLTCLCCGESRGALLVAADLAQANRFVDSVRGNFYLSVHNIVRRTTPPFADYGVLGLMWLRMGTWASWTLCDPKSTMNYHSHREYIRFENEAFIKHS